MNKEQAFTIEEITETTCKYFKISVVAILNHKLRTKHICYCRHVAQYLCCLYGHKLHVIKAYFGNINHTSIIYARRKIEAEIGIYDSVTDDINQIVKLLK